jgi:antitoxin component of RelBE/YafQ-DinJ toxin-antitoxin module
MATKQQIFTRVDPDVKEEIENYCDDRGVTQSEAVRRFVNRGLANEGYPVPATDGGSIRNDLNKLDNNLGDLDSDVREVRDDLHRNRTGIFIAVAYLATAYLTPSTLPVTLALIIVGILLAVGLWYVGMFDLSALRGGSDE